MDRRKFLKLGVQVSSVALVGPQLLLSACEGDSAGPAGDVAAGGDGDAGRAAPDGAADLPGDTGRAGGDAEVAAEVASPGAMVHAILGSELSELPDMATAAAVALGFTGSALAGATVFIKPNFVALGMEVFHCGYDPTTGEVTKPELCAALAEQCLKAGAAKVTIGEGAQTQKWDWTKIAFLPGNHIGDATDLAAAAERLNALYGAGKVELQCVNELDEWELVPSASPDPNVAGGIHVARAFATADHVISVPVLKTHQWAYLTASMKNLFGLASINLHGNTISRCNLHVAYAGIPCHGVADAGVSGAIIDIFRARREAGKRDFAVIDATIGLEGSGPHKAPVNDGRTIHLKDRNAAGKYVLLASADCVAADATAARLINVPVDDIKSLQMARHLGLGELDDITLVGATLDELRVADWMRPELRTEDYFAGICPANRQG